MRLSANVSHSMGAPSPQSGNASDIKIDNWDNLVDAVNNSTTNWSTLASAALRPRLSVSVDMPIWLIPSYSVILLFAIVGNLLVISTLAQNRRMRTITNLFLLNLAISDILLGVLCMPVTLVGTLLRHFIFGEFLCRLIPFAQATCVAVSSWTLVAISCERYYAICHPLRSRAWQTINHAYKIIVIIWLSSFLCMTPIAVYSQLIPTSRQGLQKCRENWPNIAYERCYNIMLDLMLLILPLFILCITYTLITRTLYVGMQQQQHQQQQQQQLLAIANCSNAIMNGGSGGGGGGGGYNNNNANNASQKQTLNVLANQCGNDDGANSSGGHDNGGHGDLNRTQQQPQKPHQRRQRQHQRQRQRQRKCSNILHMLWCCQRRPHTYAPPPPPPVIASSGAPHARSTVAALTGGSCRRRDGVAEMQCKCVGGLLGGDIDVVGPAEPQRAQCTANGNGRQAKSCYYLGVPQTPIAIIGQQQQQQQQQQRKRQQRECQQRQHIRRMTSGGCAGGAARTTSALCLHPEMAVLRRTNTAYNLESKRRVVKMLFVLVLEFFICWSPLYIVNTVALYLGLALYEYVDYTFISFCHLLAYSSSCCNPITYCFMNASFRRAFLDTFKGMRLCWRRRRRQHPRQPNDDSLPPEQQHARRRSHSTQQLNAKTLAL